MFESNHDIDEGYGQSINPVSQDVEDTIKDIDISPLLLFFPQACLPCCGFYQSRDDDDRSVGGNGSFSESESQRLVTSQSGGDGALTPTTLAERNAQQNRIRQRPTLVNKNIFLHFLLRFLQGTADSLWRGTVLSIFVVQLTPNSDGRSDYFRFVGYFEGMFGLGKIIAKMLYSDDIMNDSLGRNNLQSSRQQRQRTRDENNHTPAPGRQNSFTLKCAGMILLVTAISNLIILASLPKNQDYQLFYQLLMPVLLFYGYSSSVLLSSSASHALIRQSSAKSSNEKRYKAERHIALASNMVGPLISIIIFAAVGNTYKIRNLQIAWYAGCSLEMLVGILSLGFSERYQIIREGEGEEEEDVLESLFMDSSIDEAQDVVAGFSDVDNEEDVIDESTRELRQKIDRFLSEEQTQQFKAVAASEAQQLRLDESPLMEALLPLQSSSNLENYNAATLTRSDKHSSSTPGVVNNNALTDRHIWPMSLSLLPPILFVLFELLFVAGLALFHPYWPVFFKDIPQLPPIQLQTLYALIPFIVMLSTSAFQKFFEQIKVAYRIGISATVRFLGATFVMIMGTASYWGSVNSIALATLFILRMVFLDSVKKVETDVFSKCGSRNINTHVWKFGMEMTKIIVWSVCAAVGGVLIESKSQADSGYGSGSGGGGYGYALRLSGVLEFLGVVFMMMVVFLRMAPAYK